MSVTVPETFRGQKDDASEEIVRGGGIARCGRKKTRGDYRSRRGVSLAPRLRHAASFCLHPTVTGANRTPRIGGEYSKRIRGGVVGIWTWSAPFPRGFHAYTLCTPPHCTPMRTPRAPRHHR